MYSTHMTPTADRHPGPSERGDADDDVLVRLDATLLELRRFTEAPADRTASVGTDAGPRVELSTVLVVHAVASTVREPASRCDIGTVAAALRVAHSTASRLVDRAARAGMVTRGRDPDDPRRTTVSLTASGERLDADAVRFRTAQLASLLDDWTADDIGTLTALLERFARAASHTSSPAHHPAPEENPCTSP
jgi:DNA-binding MarR family transcriptional regulator